jgi:hypothetical protein
MMGFCVMSFVDEAIVVCVKVCRDAFMQGLMKTTDTALVGAPRPIVEPGAPYVQARHCFSHPARWRDDLLMIGRGRFSPYPL